MRLITFRYNNELCVGLHCASGVVNLRTAAPALPHTMIDLLGAGPAAMKTASAVLARALDDGVGMLSETAVQLLAPIPRPGKIFGIGLNYRDHASETGQPEPEVPIVFAKASTAVIASAEPIVLPTVSTMIDYEGELAVVIGRRAKGIARAAALSYVAGYTIMNDVTARDYQRRSGHTMGKSFDTFAPMGPVLATADELSDPRSLTLRTLLNGDAVQRSNTRHLIFDVAALIEFISAAVTLEPGDVITTGTPAGVGARRTPPRYLQAGDCVRVEIEGIGALENPIVASTRK